MEQIERIKLMEERLDEVRHAASRLEEALDGYEAALPLVAELEQYLGSEQWRLDYAADEAGLLPEGLKRGVLSEDGIWDVLDRYRQLAAQWRR